MLDKESYFSGMYFTEYFLLCHSIAFRVRYMSFPFFLSSLRVKLPFRIFCIVVLVFTLSIIISLSIFDSIIRSIKSEYAENAALAVSANANIQIRQAKHDLQVIATLPYVLDALEKLPEAHHVAAFQREHPNLAPSLLKVQNAFGFYRNLFLVNQAGEYIVGTKQSLLDMSAEEERQHIEKLIQFYGVNTSKSIRNPITNELLLPMFLRLEHDQHVGGLVAALQISDILSMAMRETPHDEIHAMAVTANPDGLKTVYDINDKFLPKDTRSINNALLENTRGVITVEHENEELTIGYARVSDSSIYILGIVDSSFKHAYLNTIKTAMILVSIIAAIAIFITVYLFVRPVTRDIARISAFAKNIAEGSAENNISIVRDDELGSLAQSLEHMVYSLKDMIERSEAATKAKSDFLARMSHEIRTPMNGIIGMTYLAMSAEPDKKQMEYLERIDTASKSLLSIINDILDFSKIEADKMEMVYGDLEITSMLSDIHNLLLPKCIEKHLTFACTIDDNVPKHIKTDALRLTQICTNLCSNAIKFTSHGYVSLHVSLADAHSYEKGSEFEILFTVKDTGIGMSQAEQDVVFEAFTQADGTHTRKYGGTGLGLAICKRLVDLLNGSIYVESHKGEGSSFCFTIKTMEGEEKAINNDFVPLETYPPISLDILLVEDNEINQIIAQEVLKQMGADTTLAHNGAEAVNLWETGSYDLILMDIQMPIMDGLTATKHIRSSNRPRSKTVPIIAMTAHAMTGDREKSLEAGMNDHLTKPIDIDQLRTALSFWGNSAREELENNSLTSYRENP